jgi:hypothetical protein
VDVPVSDTKDSTLDELAQANSDLAEPDAQKDKEVLEEAASVPGSSETQKDDDFELDEYGNVIVKQRIYTEKELAAMQAIYPSGILFSAEDIKNGASVLFLIGNPQCALT